MYTTKLTIEDQRKILEQRFNFIVDEDGVIYDEEGDEFHGFECNYDFDLSTIKGIMDYLAMQTFENGRREVRREIKKVLDI